MKLQRSTTLEARSMEAWASELRGVLTESGGSEPTIGKVPLDASEIPNDMLWWRALGSPAVCIGVGAQDTRLLAPSFPDILNKSWGPGEVMAQGPADKEGWEVWNVELATGENIRFFAAPGAPAADEAPNLEMLMDIELPIVIRFGHTQMALRDIAGLTAGSVIQFDRGVDEPVEVMVNGHVVALGEAVTVKGSYGIRISQISSRRERLVTSSFAMQEQTA